MNYCIENKYNGFVINSYGKKSFVQKHPQKILFTLTPLYEFALQIQGDAYTGMITSNHCERECIAKDNTYCIRYHHELFDMEATYSIDDEAVYKKLHLIAKENFTIQYAQTEAGKVSGQLSRGGEGQPIFVSDKAFISIVFPAAQNYIQEDMIRLEQAPYISLVKGAEFDFYPVIYGFATRETLEKSFLQYIKNHKRKTPAGMRIYSDWGAHDEMANEEKLDEAMALRLAANLQKGRQKGAEFDYYLMDDGWFKDTYDHFNRELWLHGQKKFLDKLEEMGMKFGLWYDVNMSQLYLADHVVRLEGDRGRICFSYKENADLFFDGVKTQLEQSNCAIIKLDFAFFECQSGEHSTHSKEKIKSKEPAVRNFIEGLNEVYEKAPNLIVLGYNGFTVDLECISSIDNNYTKYMISPWWCLYLDYLYCGDPRPSEIPIENMGESLIYYTDGMIKGFSESLMPYSAIDDHGTMIGTTNTIYYLGKGSFRNSYIMSISRGGKKAHLYGELELLDDADWKFIKDSKELLDFTSREDVETEAIFGNPRRGQVYGYSHSDGKIGYVTIVNPTDKEEAVLLEREEWQHNDIVHVCKYYSDGEIHQNNMEEIEKKLYVKLAPYEICIYKWEIRDSAMDLQQGYVFVEDGKDMEIFLSDTCQIFSLQLLDEKGSPIRKIGVYNEALTVEPLNEKTSLQRISGQTIWCGMSWAAYKVMKDAAGEAGVGIRIHNCGEKPLYVKWCER